MSKSSLFLRMLPGMPFSCIWEAEPGRASSRGEGIPECSPEPLTRRLSPIEPLLEWGCREAMPERASQKAPVRPPSVFCSV